MSTITLVNPSQTEVIPQVHVNSPISSPQYPTGYGLVSSEGDVPTGSSATAAPTSGPSFDSHSFVPSPEHSSSDSFILGHADVRLRPQFRDVNKQILRPNGSSSSHRSKVSKLPAETRIPRLNAVLATDLRRSRRLVDRNERRKAQTKLHAAIANSITAATESALRKSSSNAVTSSHSDTEHLATVQTNPNTAETKTLSGNTVVSPSPLVSPSLPIDSNVSATAPSIDPPTASGLPLPTDEHTSFVPSSHLLHRLVQAPNALRDPHLMRNIAIHLQLCPSCFKSSCQCHVLANLQASSTDSSPLDTCIDCHHLPCVCHSYCADCSRNPCRCRRYSSLDNSSLSSNSFLSAYSSSRRRRHRDRRYKSRHRRSRDGGDGGDGNDGGGNGHASLGDPSSDSDKTSDHSSSDDDNGDHSIPPASGEPPSVPPSNPSIPLSSFSCKYEWQRPLENERDVRSAIMKALPSIPSLSSPSGDQYKHKWEIFYRLLKDIVSLVNLLAYHHWDEMENDRDAICTMDPVRSSLLYSILSNSFKDRNTNQYLKAGFAQGSSTHGRGCSVWYQVIHDYIPCKNVAQHCFGTLLGSHSITPSKTITSSNLPMTLPVFDSLSNTVIEKFNSMQSLLKVNLPPELLSMFILLFTSMMSPTIKERVVQRLLDDVQDPSGLTVAEIRSRLERFVANQTFSNKIELSTTNDLSKSINANSAKAKSSSKSKSNNKSSDTKSSSNSSKKSSKSVSFAVGGSHPSHNGRKCNRCGELGHIATNCSYPYDIACTHCKGIGHIGAACRKTAGGTQALSATALVATVTSSSSKPVTIDTHWGSDSSDTETAFAVSDSASNSILLNNYSVSKLKEEFNSLSLETPPFCPISRDAFFSRLNALKDRIRVLESISSRSNSESLNNLLNRLAILKSNRELHISHTDHDLSILDDIDSEIMATQLQIDQELNDGCIHDSSYPNTIPIPIHSSNIGDDVIFANTVRVHPPSKFVVLHCQLDSGASKTLFGHPIFDQILTSPSSRIVTGVFNKRMPAKKTGSIVAQTVATDTSPTHPLRLHDVLYVPGLERNLVSVGGLTASGYRVSFNGCTAVITSLSAIDNTRIVIPQVRGSYDFDLVIPVPDAVVLANSGGVDPPIYSPGDSSVSFNTRKFKLGDNVATTYKYWGGIKRIPKDGHFHGTIIRYARGQQFPADGKAGDFRYKVRYTTGNEYVMREVDLVLSKTVRDTFNSTRGQPKTTPVHTPSPSIFPSATASPIVPSSIDSSSSASVPPATAVKVVPPKSRKTRKPKSSTGVPLPATDHPSSAVMLPGPSFDVPILPHDYLLHCKFGHPNLEALSKLSNLNPKFKLIGDWKDTDCPHCLAAKATQLFSGKSVSHSATSSWEVVHSDSGGPVTPKSSRGHQFYHLFVCGFSNFTAVYFTRDKGAPSGSNLVYSQQRLRADYGRHPRRIHADRGTDYTSTQYQDFCRMNSIQLTYSTPHHHAENGIVERLQRTLLSKVRALLFAAGAPEQLWCYALEYAVYLHNRTPRRSRHWCTPFQDFYFQPPPLDDIHNWGCTVWFYNRSSPSLPKLAPRAFKGVFLGVANDSSPHTFIIGHYYDNGRAGLQIIHSTDVRFQDSVYFFRENAIDWTTLHIMESFEPDSPTPPSSSSSLDAPGLAGVTPDSDLTNNPSSPSVPPSVPNTDENSSDSSPAVVDADDADTSDMVCSVHAFLASTVPSATLYQDPKNYKDAMNRSPEEVAKWNQAIDAEWYGNVLPNSIELVPFEESIGHQVLPTHLVFKRKPATNTEPERYKARCVVNGKRHEVEDEFSTYAPTSNAVLFRTAIAIFTSAQFQSSAPDIVMRVADVSNAFCTAEMPADQVVFIRPPLPQHRVKGKAMKLKTGLYGLRTSGNIWFGKFSNTLTLPGTGLVQSKFEPTLFYSICPTTGNLRELLIVFVDDLFYIGPLTRWNSIYSFVSGLIPLKDLGQPNCFIGIELEVSREGVYLHQSRYIKKLLAKFEFTGLNPTKTPMATAKDDKVDLVRLETRNADPSYFQSLIGSLIYASINTRLDIAFPTKECTKHLLAHDHTHIAAAKRIYRYLSGTLNLGLFSSMFHDFSIRVFTDANWTTRSTTSVVILIGDLPVAFYSKDQKSIALSTMEAELFAASQAVRIVSYLADILKELHFLPSSYCFNVYCDSQSAIDLINNNASVCPARHMNIRLAYLREKVAQGIIRFVKVSSSDNLSDIGTKALPIERHTMLVSRLMRFLPSSDSASSTAVSSTTSSDDRRVLTSVLPQHSKTTYPSLYCSNSREY